MAEPYALLSDIVRCSRTRLLKTISSVPGISAIPHEENLRYFDVMIHGPSQSPYEGCYLCCVNMTAKLTITIGGIFKLELFLPDDYPMTPPKIRFLTKIYHPNIDKLGRICLDVLKSQRPLWMPSVDLQLTAIGNWSPALQIRTILLSIQALLGAPNPDDPLANDVAQRWKEDEPSAIQTARDWTRQYAKVWALPTVEHGIVYSHGMMMLMIQRHGSQVDSLCFSYLLECTWLNITAWILELPVENVMCFFEVGCACHVKKITNHFDMQLWCTAPIFWSLRLHDCSDPSVKVRSL